MAQHLSQKSKKTFLTEQMRYDTLLNVADGPVKRNERNFKNRLTSPEDMI